MTPVGGSFDVDMFFLALLTDGTFVHAVSIGGTSTDHSSSITNGAPGTFYATGSFANVVDFDPGVNASNLTSNGGTDIFVTKWTPTFTAIENSTLSETNFNIYPNPAKNNVEIQCTGFQFERDIKMAILNVIGQEIKTLSLHSEFTNIRLENLSPGIYFYHIQLDQQIIKTGKLIVE